MSSFAASTTTTNTGLTPSQIRTAYGIDLIPPVSGKPLGYGIKIAIITVYHYSNLQNDLNVYCKRYSLVPITLNIINQAGTIRNNNWAIVSNLATQILNAVCPGATVYVIESKSTTINDIKTAILTAVNLGVNVISIPFGTNEYSTQSSLEYLFLNSNIVFIAPTGDTNTRNFPATSSNVVAVGSTDLTLNQSNTRLSETLSSTSGSGTSVYTSKPSYQNTVNSSAYRNVPDLCLVGGNGLNVYCSVIGGYLSVKGTSLSSSLFAGLVCIANQMRKSYPRQMLTSIATSPHCLQKYLYQTIYPDPTIYARCMYDISTTGYDIPSGLGGVKANELCPQLSNDTIVLVEA